MRVQCYLSVLLTVSLIGCGIKPVSRDVQTDFTYDFSIQDKDRSQIWIAARDFFASSYGDSRTVFRVQDQEQGLMLGKGLAEWQLTGGQACYQPYEIHFLAKDGRARLQFVLLFDQMEGLGYCSGWHMPSQNGYKAIVASFPRIAKHLNQVLSGSSADEDWRKF